MAGGEIHTKRGRCASRDRGGAARRGRARRWGRTVRRAVRIDVEALVFLDDPAVVADHCGLVAAVQNCDIQAAPHGKDDVHRHSRAEGSLRVLSLEGERSRTTTHGSTWS